MCVGHLHNYRPRLPGSPRDLTVEDQPLLEAFPLLPISSLLSTYSVKGTNRFQTEARPGLAAGSYSCLLSDVVPGVGERVNFCPLGPPATAAVGRAGLFSPHGPAYNWGPTLRGWQPGSRAPPARSPERGGLPMRKSKTAMSMMLSSRLLLLYGYTCLTVSQ